MRAKLTPLGRRALVVGCVAVAAVTTSQSVQAAPHPQGAPRGQGTLLKPDPGPGASSAKTSSATSSASTSPSASGGSIGSAPSRSTYVGPASQTGSGATDRPFTRSLGKSHKPRKARTAVKHRARTGVRREAALLSELRPVPGSGASWLLLAAGLVLVLLVIGETTFLGVARSRFGLATPREPARRRAAEDPYPIRQVLPRR